MRALGLAVDMPARARPALRAVLLADSLPVGSVPTLTDVRVVTDFEVPTVVDELASQLAELSKATTGRIQSLLPDIIVVRRADRPQRPVNTDGPRVRLLATGAVASAARLLIVQTHIRTGRECGSAYGSNKATVDADATRLASNSRLVEAAAAALSGLVADRH